MQNKRAGSNGVIFDVPKASEDSKGKINQKTDIATIANLITTNVKFAKDSSGRLFYYKDNNYNENAEEVIRELYKSILYIWELQHTWSVYIANGIITYILADAPKLLDRPIPNRIKLLDSIYEWDEDWENGRNIPDSSDYFTNIRLNVKFNENASCPRINKFIEEVLWDGINHETKQAARELFYQILAYLCIPSTDLQKAFLFYGPKSSNGKSKAIDLITSFLGWRNCSNVNLHDLEKERFSLGAICGKLLNVAGEIDSDKIKGSSRFKSIVSGDSVQIEFKGRDLFSYRPFCRLVFSTNKLPKSDDETDGWKRRWCILHFLNSFPQSRQKENELRELFNDEYEMSGLLNEVLPWIPLVMQYGIVTPKELAHVDNYSPPPDCIREFALEYIEKNPVGKISAELWNKICFHFVPGIHSDVPDFEKKGVMKDYMKTMFGSDIYKQSYFPEAGTTTGYVGIMFKEDKLPQLLHLASTYKAPFVKIKLDQLYQAYKRRLLSLENALPRENMTQN